MSEGLTEGVTGSRSISMGFDRGIRVLASFISAAVLIIVTKHNVSGDAIVRSEHSCEYV